MTESFHINNYFWKLLWTFSRSSLYFL